MCLAVLACFCKLKAALSVHLLHRFGARLNQILDRFWPDVGQFLVRFWPDFEQMLRNTVVQYYWDGVIQFYGTSSVLTLVKTSQNRGNHVLKISCLLL